MRKCLLLFTIVLVKASLSMGQAPAITSLSPLSGPVGTTVTITGSNFSAVTTDNIVYFGAVRATVTAATSTQLTVTAPAGSTYKPVTVTVAGLTAYSNAPFSLTFSSSAQINLATFANVLEVPGQVGPQVTQIHDFDGDNKPDVAISSLPDTHLSVYSNTSTGVGSFSFATTINTLIGTQRPSIVGVGDVDGDGLKDLLVGNTLDNVVSVLRNTSTPGNISFAAAVTFASSKPATPVLQDLDGDGRPEIIVAEALSPMIAIYKNVSTPGTIDATSFQGKVEITVNTDTNIVGVSDVDADGKPDILVSASGFASIAVLKNTISNGTIDGNSFAAPVNFATGTGTNFVVAGDLNADGKPELVVANYYSDEISVFKNTSTPGTIDANTFAPRISLYTGSSFSALVAISDINGDDKPDIVGMSSGRLIIYKNINTGDVTLGSFGTRIDIPVGSNPIGFAIGDLDGNSVPDVAVAGDDKMYVLRNLMMPPPTITNFSPATEFVGNSVSITGTNFDVPIGNIGVTFKTAAGGDVAGTIIAKSATNITVTIPGTAVTGPFTVIVAGVSVTSATDLVIKSAPTINSFSPGAGLVGSTVVISGSGFDPVAANNLVKFNGTSAVVTASTATSITATVPVGATSGTISVTLGPYSPSTGLPFVVALPTPPPVITSFSPLTGPVGTTVTITGSNFSAIPSSNVVYFGAARAVVSSASTTQLVVAAPAGSTYKPMTVTTNGLTAFSRTPFSLTFPSDGTIVPTSFTKVIEVPGQVGPQVTQIHDFDGDNKPDIAISSLPDTHLSVYPNSTSAPGAISFLPQMSMLIATQRPSIVAVGDVDGDGLKDLVVANTLDNFVSVLKNTSTPGHISFAPKITFPSTKPATPTIADLDGDGRAEILVAEALSPNIAIFRNVGTPGTINANTFLPRIQINVNTDTNIVAVQDVDGDNKPDILVSASGNNSIAILRNNISNGFLTPSSFASPVNFYTNTGTNFIVAGDLDGDSKPDLVAANYYSNQISVFRNNSSPGSINSLSFSLSTTLTVLNSFSALVAIHDVDGDGKPDIVGMASGQLSIFKNVNPTIGSLGSASFAPRVDVPIGSNPIGFSIGDLDGDGKPDVGVAGDDKMYVLRNVMAPPVITSFTPTSGLGATTSTPGTSVTIAGNYFSTDIFDNVVKFNGVPAVVTASTTTSISTTVPAGATSGKITVSVNGLVGTSATDFTVLLPTGDLHIYGGEKTITFYPNPSSDEIIIDMSDLEKGKQVQVTIYDLNGRQIETCGSVGGKTLMIDIRQYVRGNYIIRAVQDQRKYANMFVKQ